MLLEFRFLEDKDQSLITFVFPIVYHNTLYGEETKCNF